MGMLERKKLFEDIQWENTKGMLVWKHPSENFNTSSVLIVHESQVAVFFKNGQVADIFDKAGRYVLKTENIPVLRKIMELPTGGESTFHCEVYFVTMVECMGMKWGTRNQFQFVDPIYNVPMTIGASGEMSLRIQEPVKFLKRLIGTERELTPEKLVDYFRGIVTGKISSYLAREITKQQLSIFTVDSQLDILSDSLKDDLQEIFSDYGVELVQFIINHVVKPEDNSEYCKLREVLSGRFTEVYEAQTEREVQVIQARGEADSKIIAAQAYAKRLQVLGIDAVTDRSFDLANKIAENQSIGQFTNMGVGIGMMTGIGGTLGGTVSGLVGGALEKVTSVQNSLQQEKVCDAELQNGSLQKDTDTNVKMQQAAAIDKICRCGAQLPIKARYCMQCGSRLPALCSNCGAEINENAQYCMLCGQRCREDE